MAIKNNHRSQLLFLHYLIPLLFCNTPFIINGSKPPRHNYIPSNNLPSTKPPLKPSLDSPLLTPSISMTTNGASEDDALSLTTIRNVLIRLEDTIIFSLIERAKFPINSKAYTDCSALSTAKISGLHSSFAELFIRESEAVQSMFGRYENPEETPFFPSHLPPSPCLPSFNFPKVLYPAAASVNVSSQIWEFYFKQLLPLFTSQGDDGNFASTVACDLTCLQALARRIHYGKFVAEAKFRGAPKDYEPPIRSKDEDTIMRLLTDERVEEMVKQRVAKKAAVFGQDVTLNDTGSSVYKVDPSVVSRLYSEWVIPLTKVVEVDYLLRRLD